MWPFRGHSPRHVCFFFLLSVSTIIFLGFSVLFLPQSNLKGTALGNEFPNSSPDFQPITCLIDGKNRRVPCVRQNRSREVFLPFNGFLKKRFDLRGDTKKNSHYFEYFTSDLPIRFLRTRNQSLLRGPLDQFNNVALRPRIKCLKPENGLPMSVQWNSVPYFYPVQILQFGFDYFTKNFTEKRTQTERRLKEEIVKYSNKNFVATQRRSESSKNIQFKLFDDLPFLLFSWKALSSEAFFEVIFEARQLADGWQKFRLKFGQQRSEECVWRVNDEKEGNGELHFFYSLTPNDDFRDFLLDLPVFVEKAWALLRENSIERTYGFIPVSLHFSGLFELRADSVRQKNFAHHEIFLNVAKWLLKNQDDLGGWPIPVGRVFNNIEKEADHRQLFQLHPGWHSAMAQGHALSFFARAFNTTNDDRFLLAGEKATALFELSVEEGGVLNRLFGFDWFEEYPTSPNGTFVLNGFLYALIGLNDFSPYSNRSRALFQRGLRSLRALLPLFDTGQRSLYDLRHVQTNGKIRPNIARWDYHALHISLLDWLFSLTQEGLFSEVAQRWADYAHGMALKHN